MVILTTRFVVSREWLTDLTKLLTAFHISYLGIFTNFKLFLSIILNIIVKSGLDGLYLGILVTWKGLPVATKYVRRCLVNLPITKQEKSSLLFFISDVGIEDKILASDWLNEESAKIMRTLRRSHVMKMTLLGLIEEVKRPFHSQNLVMEEGLDDYVIANRNFHMVKIQKSIVVWGHLIARWPNH